jgi:hypothetical protein
MQILRFAQDDKLFFSQDDKNFVTRSSEAKDLNRDIGVIRSFASLRMTG